MRRNFNSEELLPKNIITIAFEKRLKKNKTKGDYLCCFSKKKKRFIILCAILITLYLNKMVCNNYHNISIFYDDEFITISSCIGCIKSSTNYKW